MKKYMTRSIQSKYTVHHRKYLVCKNKIKGKSYQMKYLEKIHWWLKQVDRRPNGKV